MNKTISVDAEALRQVLVALLGQPHQIRELLATRGLPEGLGDPNPINRLIEAYNLGWAANEAGGPQPAQAARTAIEQYDLEQSEDYRKGYNDGRVRGYGVGYRQATSHAAMKSQPAKNESSEYMDIYTRPGTQIVFHAKGGYDHEKEEAKAVLQVGQTYTVQSIEVGRCSSKVRLREAQGNFNTVMFGPAPTIQHLPSDDTEGGAT